MRNATDRCRNCHWFNGGDSMGLGKCLRTETIAVVTIRDPENHNGRGRQRPQYKVCSQGDWCHHWQPIEQKPHLIRSVSGKHNQEATL